MSLHITRQPLNRRINHQIHPILRLPNRLMIPIIIQ